MFRVFSRNNIQATRKWSLIAGTNLIYNCKVPKVISHKSGEQQLTMTFQMVPGFLLFSWLVAHTTKTVFHILKYFITIERPINLTYFRRKNNCSKRSHHWCLLPKPPKAEISHDCLPHWSTQIESAKMHLVLNCLATAGLTPDLWLMSRHLISKDTSPRSAALSRQITESVEQLQ